MLCTRSMTMYSSASSLSLSSNPSNVTTVSADVKSIGTMPREFHLPLVGSCSQGKSGVEELIAWGSEFELADKK